MTGVEEKRWMTGVLLGKKDEGQGWSFGWRDWELGETEGWKLWSFGNKEMNDWSGAWQNRDGWQ